MKKMTVEELISRYDIKENFGPKAGTISCFNAENAKADGIEAVKREIVSRKPEILDYFQAQRDEKARKEWEREAKINAIPGLAEIKELRNAWDRYNRDFERSFEGEYACGGMTTVKRPAVKLETLLEKYPAAAAYLRAESEEYGGNAELSAIGRRAKERIIEAPEAWEEAMTDMGQEISAFADRHAWD